MKIVAIYIAATIVLGALAWFLKRWADELFNVEEEADTDFDE